MLFLSLFLALLLRYMRHPGQTAIERMKGRQLLSSVAAAETATTPSVIGNAGSKSNVVISWTAPPPIMYGTALNTVQLAATANVPGSFTYSPQAGTILRGGGHTLTTTFIPSDVSHYSSATASVQIHVSRATPTVAWMPPPTMAQGSALGAAQLDAEANIPGTFTYYPPAGTILVQGTQRLAVNFSPTDSIDYSSVTRYRSISPIPVGCGGPTINLNNGMSTSTLQSIISSAPDCSLIIFAAGTYNITSKIKLPCPKTGMTITGPTVAYPGPYTATLNGSVAGDWGFSYGSCSAPVTIEYLNWNGGEPEAGGGGFLYVGPATSNLTVQYNFIHGNQANTVIGHEYDGLIWLDGANGDGLVDNNITIRWNQFGASNDGSTANADCGAISTLFNYQGANYDHIGGNCVAIGWLESTTNMSILNNNIHFQEQGLKGFQPGAGYTFTETNLRVLYNDIQYIHRIEFEIQQTLPSGAGIGNFNYNDTLNPTNPGYASWGFSLSDCCQNSSNNVHIANLLEPYAKNTGPGAYEFWGSGHADNNLVQGYQGIMMQYGFPGPTGGWTMSNNIMQQLSGTNSFIVNEENVTCCYPAMTGNIQSTTLSAITSAAPTISPTPSGSYSAPISVTLTDMGVTSGGAGPQGNTTIYYTLDGSTPTTSSTPCNTTPGSTSCTISVPPGSTVQAIGMWGSINQPKSYPTGYGFVPSAVVSASYIAGGAVKAPAGRISSVPAGTQTTTGNNATAAVAENGPATAAFQTVAIVPSAPAVAIGATTQLKAIATLSDGSTKDVTADVAWRSSDPKTIAVSSSGLLSGLASGQALLLGAYQGQLVSVPATSSIGDIKWSPPIVITQGGTYSGNWQSTDAKTPGVTIATADPVVIQDSHISSSGALIKVDVKGADLSVRNSLGLALTAGVKGQPNGVFVDAASPARLDVENNYMENVRYGVLVHGYTGSQTEQRTIVVRGNRARNLNGLLSDGKGGYLPGEGANQSPSGFLKLQDVQAVPGIDLGWNEVINYPAHSLVSDVIDLYRASGTPNQPLEVHDTFIQGAYPYKPAQDAYQGGGIKTDGAADDTPQNASAFSYIHDNQVVGTVGYGIAFSAGHDNVAANNRVISSGLLADGTKIRAQQSALSSADEQGNRASSIYNNTMYDNVVGWTCLNSTCNEEDSRKALFFPASPGDYSSNSVVPDEQITLEIEENEYRIWLNKIASVGITLGPSF